MAHKIVLYPIRVPDGKFCWEFTGEKSLCPQFDNEGGCPTCKLDFYPIGQRDEKRGYSKPKECLCLKKLERIKND